MNGKKLNNIRFISEIASTHNGSKKELTQLIKSLNSSKTDYIKFQIFEADELCHKTSKMYQGLKKVEIIKKQWKKILGNKFHKKIILEPFDENSYEFCKNYKKNFLIKIPASEHHNDDMIYDSVLNFKKVFFNFSGFNLNEITQFLKKFNKYKKKFVLMYGFQSFPSNPKDLRLSIVKKIKSFGYHTGYADHSLTDDKILTYLLTSKAIDLGVNYIEKHVTLDRRKKKPDYISSFEINEYNEYVKYFKKDHIIKFRETTSSMEKKYCNIMGKFAVSKNKLLKNTTINLENLKFLRTNNGGLSKKEIQRYILQKKKFKKDILSNKILTNKYFH